MHHPKVTARKGHGLGLTLLLLAVLSLTLFAFAGPAAAFDALDQQQTSTDGSFAQLSGFTSVTQTFTAGHTGPLAKISVYIGGVYSFSDGGWSDFTVQARISTTSGTELGTTQLPVAGASHWQDITFTSAPTLTAGEQYRIELQLVSGDSFYWYATTSNPYSGGSASCGEGWDMCFKTYCYIADTTPPVVVPPADVMVNDPTCSGIAVNFGAASATDDMDPAIPAGSIHYYTDYGTDQRAEVHSGDTFPVGVTTVTAAATDSSGNTGTATFTVTVRDIGQVAVDQQETLPPDSIVHWPSDELYGQTFTAGRSGPLTKVSLSISNRYASDFDVQALICTWPLSGAPTGAQILASTTVHFGARDSGSWWQDFTFPSPAAVTEGTQYAIVLSGVRFGWWQVYDPYFGSETNYECADGNWYSGYGENFLFKTYVEGTPPVVTPPDNPRVEATSPDGAEVTLAATATDKLGTDISSSIHYYTAYGTASQAEVRSGGTFPFGGTRVTAEATDASGNTGRAAFYVAVKDTIPPVTSSDASSGWQNDNVVHFNASDSGSGIAHTYYTVDGGAETEGTSVTVEEGTHSLSFWSVDSAGNSEPPKVCSVSIDSAGPSASISGAPASWVNHAVPLSFSADDGSGSGVDFVEYKLGDGPWTKGSAVDITDEGTTLVTCRATDKVGNVGPETSASAFIDTAGPSLSDDSPAGWTNHDVTVTLVAQDALSGVANVEYRLDNGGWTAGSSVLIKAPRNGSNDGVHTIAYRATDNVGTISERSCTVRIDTQGPLVVASPLSLVKRGDTASFKYKVSDKYSPTATVTIKVRDLRGRSVATWQAGSVATGILQTYRVKLALDRGVYSAEYDAVDLAGNSQALAGFTALIVH